MEYAIVIEKSATGYSAYVPDLPGCAALARTEAEVRKLIREGIHIHLDEMRIDGERIPVPTTRVEYVEVTEAALAT
jgi:predicted RNase H-like HicB family nuclease